MGSTSYDEARDPNDATWSGASWYGPSTGEYWIINPREYADPRKHGPEYQSRARRMAAAGAAEAFDLDEAAGADDAAGPRRATASGATESSAGPVPGREPRRAEPWSFERQASAGGTATAAGAHVRTTPPHGRSASREAWGDHASDAAATSADDEWKPGWPSTPSGGGRAFRLARGSLSPADLLAGSSDDPVRRFGIALIAWPPIGLAAAGVIGDLTGCAAYSASCDGTEPLLPWLAQAVILGLLLLIPPLARVFAGGAIGILAALVPLTFFLIAVGGSGAAQAGFALTFFLAIAWVAGVAWALAEARRRGRAPVRARPGARA
jgi:hypothetical protein